MFVSGSLIVASMHRTREMTEFWVQSRVILSSLSSCKHEGDGTVYLAVAYSQGLGHAELTCLIQFQFISSPIFFSMTCL